MSQSLPVDAILPALCQAVTRTGRVVLRAATGAGKTTRVPPALLDSGAVPTGRLLMLQPRRVAARAAARRISAERNSPLGEEVGYIVRFDQRISARTRIAIITEGVLLRMMQDDPFLESVGGIIFDEFHERSLNSDLALAMARRIQQTVREDLRLVVMSATLDPAPISRFLGDCPLFDTPGRLFPVDIEYRPGSERRTIAEAATSGVMEALSRTTGDLLVFLPGVGEIRQTERLLSSQVPRDEVLIQSLYGDLPPEQQDAVLLPQSRRRIILATNVAETSLTIEGISGVVDTGYARVMEFAAESGMNRLMLRPISRASADQRTGRAGRTARGICLRMWDQRLDRARPEVEEPEIRRVDLSEALLQLLAWGERDLENFPWYESPPSQAIQHAARLVHALGGTDAAGDITSLGRALSKLPLHPRLGRLLIEGRRRGCAREAALAAAMLSERDPFRHEPSAGPGSGARPRRPGHASRSDLLDRLEAIREFELRGRQSFEFGTLHEGGTRRLLQTRDQLLRSFDDSEPDFADSGTLSRPTGNERHARNDFSPRQSELLLRALIPAYADRLARRREPTSDRALMVGGQGVRLAPDSAVTDSELFLCLMLDGAGSDAAVRLASGVEREWLPEEQLTRSIDLIFDRQREQVMARRRVRWNDLVLEESPAALPDSRAVAELLAAQAATDLPRVLPSADSTFFQFVRRVQSLRNWKPELNLPSFDDAQLCSLLPNVAAAGHCRSFAELKAGRWLEAAQAMLDYDQLRAVDREAPERITVPSGSNVRIEYEPGRPPVLAVRIQEMFGLPETPRIAGGRRPLLLHLLAPNYRPQQITDDLASFWKNGYPEVRKELRRRYPKHAWPDDPLLAPPQIGPKRRS